MPIRERERAGKATRAQLNDNWPERTSEHVAAAENSEHALAPILVDHDVLLAIFV